jgi:hypothetical protein
VLAEVNRMDISGIGREINYDYGIALLYEAQKCLTIFGEHMKQDLSSHDLSFLSR